MSEQLRFAFLNCFNLFPVGVVSRGPPDAASLDQKIHDLAETLGGAFPARSPDLIGLCEVGSAALGERLAEELAPDRYTTAWSGQPSVDQTGLMILFDPAVVLPTSSSIELGPEPSSQRTRWMAMELQMQIGNRGAFWFVANHWKSQMGSEQTTQPDRMNSAREIGEFFLDTARISTEAMLLAGDFNCEPGDWPFKYQQQRDPGDPDNDRPNRLKGVRERALALRDGNRLAYVYNPMWRHVGECDVMEIADQPGYVAPRLIGSHGGLNNGRGWIMFDQLLVTKRMLKGGEVTLVEGSVRLLSPVNGCSDHCAVTAIFRA